MTPLTIFIKCNPPKSTAQGSSRILKGKGGRFFVGKAENSKASAARADLVSLLSPHVPAVPFCNPVSVEIGWTYPWRKSEKKSFLAKGFRYCDTKPDCDNLMKLLFDSMTRIGFWTDDSIISDVRFVKKWGDEPGINITVNELEGDY